MNFKFGKFLNIGFSLSEINTWRNFPNSYKFNNFTELNHFFNKTSIFLLISLLLEKKYHIDINFKNFKDIILGYLLSKYALKDINVDLFENIEKKYIIEYIQKFFKDEGIQLSKKEKFYLEQYYLNNIIEKNIWNLSSTIVNNLDFQIIKQDNFFNINEMIEETEKKINNWFEKSLEVKPFIDIKDKLKEDLLNLNEVFKFIYNSTYQLRWDGNPMHKKLSIGEHQIIVLVNFFYMIENIFKKELNNKEIFYNSINLIFHDLPEIYTKDIISPIKKAIPGLRERLEENFEKKALNSLFIKKLDDTMKKELLEINIFSPFEDKIYNNQFIYGKIGKYVDDFTALYEVIYNIENYNLKNDFIKSPINIIYNKYNKSNITVMNKLIYNLLKEKNLLNLLENKKLSELNNNVQENNKKKYIINNIK